jgi:hypothetical protein
MPARPKFLPGQDCLYLSSPKVAVKLVKYLGSVDGFTGLRWELDKIIEDVDGNLVKHALESMLKKRKPVKFRTYRVEVSPTTKEKALELQDLITFGLKARRVKSMQQTTPFKIKKVKDSYALLFEVAYLVRSNSRSDISRQVGESIQGQTTAAVTVTDLTSMTL